MTLGGVLGGTFFASLGYCGVFVLFAVISLLAIPMALIFKEARDHSREDSSQLRFISVLSYSRPLFNLVCNAVCDLHLMALEPTLAIKLRTDFGLTTSQIGVFFFLFGLGSALSMALVLLLPEHWDKKKISAPAMVLMAVFTFLVGPSSLLYLPNSPVLIGAGILLGGACRGVCCSLCPTDAVVGGIRKFPLEEARVSDIVGSMYNLLYGVASLLFPIAGSALVKSVGFRSGFDIISIGLLINATVYLAQ